MKVSKKQVITIAVLLQVIISIILVIFAVCASNLESDISSIRYNSTESLLSVAIELSRSTNMHNIMIKEIQIGQAQNKTLINILTSNSYRDKNNQVTIFIKNANKSLSDFKSNKIILLEKEKPYTYVKEFWVILSIINALTVSIVFLLERKLFVKSK